MIFFASVLLLFMLKPAVCCKIKTELGTYDLSPLAGKSYQAPTHQTMYGNKYEFSICSNSAASTSCTNTISDSCAVQILDTRCYNLGKWDNSYKVSTTPGFLLIKFANGESDDCTDTSGKTFSRSITFTFTCNNGVEIGTLTSEEPDQCAYEITIPTKYVCSEYILPNATAGLSGGSIFLIILLVVITVYCVGGFGFNKYRGSAEGFEAVPHASFWCTLLPFWVKTGCMVCWAFTVNSYLSIKAKITGVNPVNRGHVDTDADGEYANLD